MQNRYSIAIILALCNLLAHTQNHQLLDSLRSVYKNEKQDTSKINLLNRLAEEYLTFDMDSAAILAEKSLTSSREIDYKKGISNALFHIATVHKEKANYDIAINLYSQCLELYTELDDQKGIAGTLNFTGKIYELTGKPSRALELHEKSLEIRKEIGDKAGMAYSLHSIGIIYDDKGEFDKALALYKKGLEIRKEIGDKVGMAHSLNNIGTIYFYLGEYDKALDLHHQSLEIEKELGNKKGIGTSMHNIGYIYNTFGEYDKALNMFKQSLSFRKASGDKRGIALTNLSLGNVYYQKGADRKEYIQEAFHYYEQALARSAESNLREILGLALHSMGNIFVEKNDYDTALKYYRESLDVLEELGKRLEISNTSYSLGELYRKIEKHELAISYFEKSLNIAREIDANVQLSKMYLGLSHSHKALNQLANAQKYAELVHKTELIQDRLKAASLLTDIHFLQGNLEETHYFATNQIQLKDSLSKMSNQAQVDSMLTEMQSVRALELERKENELALQVEKQKNLYRLGILAFLALFGLFAGILYRNRAIHIRNREEAVRKMRDNLFSNLSHEFRTPLTIVSTILTDMVDGTFKGSYPHYSKMMLKNIKRLEHLSGQMFDLSKISENKLVIHKTEQDVTSLIKGLLDSLSSLCIVKDVTLHYIKPVETIVLNVDQDSIQKILVNIVHNAVKFSNPGGLIIVTLKIDPHNWTIKCTDNGVGIAKENLPHIFDRYFRGYLDSKSDISGGLGLAVTKQLVSINNGSIAVESEKGKGTTFTITFPHQISVPRDMKSEKITITNYFEQSKPSEPSKAVPSLFHGKKPSILLIEDNHDLNEMLSKKLGEEYHVYSAYNGAEGLSIIETNTPDLILLDVMMPHMNGLEFIRIFNENPKYSHIPIIVVSALEGGLESNSIWKEGIIDFVRKPFEYNVLAHQIRNVFNIRNQFRKKIALKTSPAIIESETSVSNMDKKFLEELINYVLVQKKGESTSIEEISQAMNLSRSAFYNKITALTGMSPSHFIRKIKLQKAKELLESNVDTIAGIAYQVGFSSPSLFSRVFKEEFGVNPSSVRDISPRPNLN